MSESAGKPIGVFLASQSNGLITVGFDRRRMGKDRYQEMTTPIESKAVKWLISRGMPKVHARELINNLRDTKPDHSLVFNPGLGIS